MTAGTFETVGGGAGGRTRDTIFAIIPILLLLLRCYHQPEYWCCSQKDYSLLLVDAVAGNICRIVARVAFALNTARKEPTNKRTQKLNPKPCKSPQSTKAL